MYKVTYSFYGKYQNEKLFDKYEAAKKFFYFIMKNPKVTKTELIVN